MWGGPCRTTHHVSVNTVKTIRDNSELKSKQPGLAGSCGDFCRAIIDTGNGLDV